MGSQTLSSCFFLSLSHTHLSEHEWRRQSVHIGSSWSWMCQSQQLNMSLDVKVSNQLGYRANVELLDLHTWVTHKRTFVRFLCVEVFPYVKKRLRMCMNKTCNYIHEYTFHHYEHLQMFMIENVYSPPHTLTHVRRANIAVRE